MTDEWADKENFKIRTMGLLNDNMRLQQENGFLAGLITTARSQALKELSERGSEQGGFFSGVEYEAREILRILDMGKGEAPRAYPYPLGGRAENEREKGEQK